MVDVNLVISGVIGLAPALALLFIALRKYDYPYVEKTLFDTRKVFFLLAVGIVFGMVVTFLDASILKPPDLIIILLFAIGFALFEEMFKFVVLNLKRMQLKFDTVFYGFSLGVGLSSTFVLSHIYFSILLYSSVPTSVWISFIIYSVILCLVHGSTGALIGYGAAKGKPWYFFGEAMTIRLFFIVVLIPLIGNIGEEWMMIVSLVVALLLSILIYYYYIAKDIIPGALPDSLRRRKRMESRRIKKRKS